MKGGRIIQLEIQFIVLRQRQCRDVLIGRRVEVLHHSGNVDDSSNVRTVGTSARHFGGTDRSDEIRARAGSQSGNHRLAVSVIKHKLIGVSHEARSLLLRWLVKALFIKLNHQASRQDEGTFVEFLWIGCRKFP